MGPGPCNLALRDELSGPVINFHGRIHTMCLFVLLCLRRLCWKTRIQLSTSECELPRTFFIMNKEILTRWSRIGDSVHTPCSFRRYFCFLMWLRWVVELYRRFPAPNTCRVFVACRPRRPHSSEVRLDLSLSLCRLFVGDSRTLFCPCVSGWFARCPRTVERPEQYQILSFTSSHLPPYCDDANRAARLRGWLSRRVASGARATSCSHSCSNRGNLCQCFPNAHVHCGVCTFSSPGFPSTVQPGVCGLPRESRSSAASHSLRSAVSLCAASAKEVLL